eukprot:TRINITY_DN708_c2_g2_i1.p1 TRINITY_DN708_c2_g2~~TRINITY_DN708_c2_g2_i1.p1  ORF type:complete len:407 (+),score=74.38 TRINITY_DN708_c2_g2_i1:59-1279(+)
MPSKYLLSTSIGINEEVIQEVAEKLAGIEHVVENSPFGLKSYVLVTHNGDGMLNQEIVTRLRTMRSIHDILLYHGHLALPEVENPPLELYNILKEKDSIQIPTLEKAAHFRVTCMRLGKHNFHATDVEMEVGGALHERYEKPAKMKGYERCIRADVIINTVVISTLVNNTENSVSLSKRHKLAFVRTVTLKPNVAYAMLRLAQVKDGDDILDPFVGSGTILLEAAEVFPNITGYGLDRSGAAVKGSKANAVAANLSHRMSFVHGNARTLHVHYGDKKFDKIVSNFPWGIKTGKTAEIRELYKGTIYSAWGALKTGGILCCIVLHDKITIQLLRGSGNWDVLSAKVVKTGGKLPAIIVARKREQDTVLYDLQKQRSATYQYLQDYTKATDDDDKKGDDTEMAASKDA